MSRAHQRPLRGHSMASSRPPRLEPSRAGTVYLIVLSTVTLVVAISLTGLTLAHAQRRTVALSDETDRARALALSGLEVGIDMINSVGGWRGRADRNGTIAAFSLDAGRVSVSAADPTDQDLLDSATEPVDLTATVKLGQALQTCAVTLAPQYTPTIALTRSLQAGGTMTVNRASLIATAPIAANISIIASSASIIADAESLVILGDSFYGSRRTLSAADPMPAVLTSAYVAEGTAIPFSAINSRDLKDVFLSPTSNPLSGTRNPGGVYIVDCAGESLTIKDMRLLGTLVLLNAGSNTKVDDGVILQPAKTGYPVLVVNGPLKLAIDEPIIKEDNKVNFNPPGSPINGISNSTITDTFPTLVTGVIYASGAVEIDGKFSLQGSVIAGGSMIVKGTLTVGRTLDPLMFPPPGFRDRMIMAVVPGSWRRLIDAAEPR
jgi:hypothetical protein